MHDMALQVAAGSCHLAAVRRNLSVEHQSTLALMLLMQTLSSVIMK